MKLRPRAEALCFRHDKVLCHWTNGYVCFPGGGVDPNESPIQAAKRETMEEADRVLMNCTIAHEPTTQVWPASYAKKAKWSKGYDGGLTFWITGTVMNNPLHRSGAGQHEDYEPAFAWHDISDVLDRLATEASGDWADDVAIRQSILRAHVQAHAPYKAAWHNGLRLSNSFLGVS